MNLADGVIHTEDFRRRGATPLSADLDSAAAVAAADWGQAAILAARVCDAGQHCTLR